MTLVLPTDLREAVVEHAREGAPEEVVGVLGGERGASEASTSNGRAGSGSEARPREAPRKGERGAERPVSRATREMGDDVSTVERHYPAENAASTPETRYEINPAEELELLERVDDAGLDVVGFYHSHPAGPLAPSETDARLAAWPRYSYVIVSLEGDSPELGSWRWTGETFEREPVEVR